MLLEFAECVCQIDHNTTAPPRTLVTLVARENLEVAAINEEPDLDEIVAAVMTRVCVRVAHAPRSAMNERR